MQYLTLIHIDPVLLAELPQDEYDRLMRGCFAKADALRDAGCLHGSQQLYVSRYTDHELDGWAERVRGWQDRQLDVYVYFDNDGAGHAPYDALRLRHRLEGVREVPVIPEGFRGRM